MEGIENRYWEKLRIKSPSSSSLANLSRPLPSGVVLDKKAVGLGNGPRLTGSLIVAARSLSFFQTNETWR